MQNITKLLAFLIIALCATNLHAQDSINISNNEKIEVLKELKEKIKAEEREKLKAEVEAINQRLDKGEISQNEAEKLKKEAAKKHALNIENRLAIVNNKIELLKRNNSYSATYDGDDGFTLRIGGSKDAKENFIYLGPKSKDKPRRYDRRTSSDLVFAIGFNNALIDGQSIDDSPYKLGGSGFVELGWAWKTRVFKNSNAVRLKYGFSFMWNKLDIKDGKYLVNNDGNIQLEDFPYNLDKAKFRTTNLVFPVHFEFGPSKRIERKDYFRYSTHRQFKIGLGGFAGFNLQGMQKLKYKNDGDKVKD